MKVSTAMGICTLISLLTMWIAVFTDGATGTEITPQFAIPAILSIVFLFATLGFKMRERS